MTCPECARAENDWTWGGVMDGCDGCMARTIARSPAHIRDSLFEVALTERGSAGLILLKEAVRREFRRIGALREADFAQLNNTQEADKHAT